MPPLSRSSRMGWGHERLAESRLHMDLVHCCTAGVSLLHRGRKIRSGYSWSYYSASVFVMSDHRSDQGRFASS